MKLTRVLAGFASVALLVVGLVAFLPDSASATTCYNASGLSKESAQSALKDSTAVFSGEVIKKEEVHKTVETVTDDYKKETIPVTKITLKTSKVWKGPKRETTAVFTGELYPVIGYTFKKGQGYLVFADQGPYGMKSFVDGCGETMSISDPEDLKTLWLADTSGIVPGYGALGLAGLTATGAFLLMRRLLKIR
jgi:hypothetical protein